MSEHTKGQIRVGTCYPTTLIADHPNPEQVRGSDNVDFYGGYLIGESVAPPNARRLAACWNACEGVPTEVLEDVTSSERQLLDAYKVLRAERDALVVELELIAKTGMDARQCRDAAVAAITKAAIAKDWGAV